MFEYYEIPCTENGEKNKERVPSFNKDGERDYMSLLSD